MSVLLPGYRVMDTLGRGARSVIYKVEESRTGKFFALKRVVRGPDDDNRFIDQVETEHKVTSQIDCPYLRRSLAIHRRREWLTVREVLLLSEYVDAPDLEHHRPGRLDVFLGIFKRVAEGLDALHESGFLHADIKPRNILWAPRGVVKIIDFGQACPIGQRKERIQGTPDYIAPEQVRKQVLDRRTDVFNVGASMYWVLTGSAYPTDLVDNRTGGFSIRSAPPPLTPHQINPKIPLALSNLVMECCRQSPAQRPVDMKEVRKRLAAIQTRWRKIRLAARTKRTPTPETRD